METHLDSDSPLRKEIANQFIDSLKAKAEQIRSLEKSRITGGAEGEPILAQWTTHGVGVRHLPPDEHGILRISIGGGDDTPVPLNYCVFRGEHGACVELLRKALRALEAGPED